MREHAGAEEPTSDAAFVAREPPESPAVVGYSTAKADGSGHARAYLLLLAALLCNCTFSREKREDSHLEVQEHAQQKAAQQTMETRTEGPETITTTVEEWEVPVVGSDPASGPLRADLHGAAKPSDTSGSVSPAAPATGSTHLVKRTITVDQRGPVVDTKATAATQTAAEDVGLDLTRHAETKTKDAPALAGFLWVALLVGAIGGAAWLAWRFSLPGRVMALFK